MLASSNIPDYLCRQRKWKWSRSVMSDSLWPHGLQPTRLLCPWDIPGKNTGVGCHFLLWGGIFLTQGSNPGLPHCRQRLYHLSHQGSLFRQYWLSTMSGNADCLHYNHSCFLLMESALYLALESIKIMREGSLPDLMGWTLIRLSQSCYVDFNLFAVIMLGLDRWHNSD